MSNNNQNSGKSKKKSSDINYERLDALLKKELLQEIGSTAEGKNLLDNNAQLSYLEEQYIPDFMINTQGEIAELINDPSIMDGKNREVVELLPNNEQQQLSTVISLSFDGLEEDDDEDTFEVIGHITAYDREVLDAISTLYMSGHREFSANMVYKTMTGIKGDTYVKNETCKSVRESIEKLRKTHLYIKESTLINLGEGEDNKIEFGIDEDATLILVTGKSLYIGGNRVSGYEISQPPIIYKHAKKTHQLRFIPASVLSVKELSNTPENVALRGYLNRKIERARDFNKVINECFIDYEDLYKYLNKEDAHRRLKFRLREKVKVILDSWIKVEYITSYEVITSGKNKKVATKIFYPNPPNVFENVPYIFPE
ncbi:hypothetical protein [Eubacterium limosum]|uniref:hypothetical protein n=1 Tax=Eubacterium limosum TaxID=1736 RepID=UPI0037200369